MNIYLMTLLAVVLPPLAVYLNAGITRQFWINLLLTMLGFVINSFVNGNFNKSESFQN